MKNNLTIFFIHLACWGVFICTWFFMRADAFSMENVKQYPYPFYGVLVIVFYLNYSLLYPSLYRSKKFFWYFLFLALIVAGLKIFQWLFTNIIGSNFIISVPSHHPNSGTTFLSMMIASMLAVSLLIRLGQDNLKKEREKQRLLNDRLSIEMNYLKSRVSPHFLLNSMNNIHAMVKIGHPKTSTMVAGVSDILRYLLYQTQQSEIMLAEEINLVKSFIEIHKLKSEYQNTVTLELSGDFEKIAIEPMLLLPLVENAFKHGDYDSANGATISIKIKYAAGSMALNISNSCSSEPVKTGIKEGLGLKNVKSRLELRYPSKHYLTYNLQSNRFDLNLSIDLS
jgi:two-component system LytT family sensor kinase